MKNILFTDDFFTFAKENYDENEEWNENEVYDLISNDCEDFHFMLKDFDKKHNNKILVIASLGLWYGRREATKVLNNLGDCFSLCEDTNTFYTERKNGTIKLEAAHHDGINYFAFYELVNGKKKAITMRDLYS